MPAVERFQQAEQAYRDLRQRLASGWLTPAQFETAVANLRVQDEFGRHWTIHKDTGGWLAYDGQKWVNANPYPQQPAQAPYAPQPAYSQPVYQPPPMAVPPPAASQPVYVQPVYVQPAYPQPVYIQPKKGGIGCGKLFACGCLVTFLLVAGLGVGGYFAITSGAITLNGIMAMVGMGPAYVEVDNFRDDGIYVRLTQLQPAEGQTPIEIGDSVGSFDIRRFTVSTAGPYQVDFMVNEATIFATCHLMVRGSGEYQFVPMPAATLVNDIKHPASQGPDFLVETSSLCR